MKGVSAGTSFVFFAILLLLMFAYAGTHPSAFSILAVTPPVRPQKQQSILQPNIIVLGQCMTLKPCTDPDIRFSYFGTGMVTHKIAVEKAGDDRYFLICIKHGVPPEFSHTGQIIAYFLCIHKQSCTNRASSVVQSGLPLCQGCLETCWHTDFVTVL